MSVAWDTPLASPRWSWQFGQLDLRRSHVRSCRSRSSSATAESIAAAGTTIKLTLCKPLKDGELGTEMRQQCQRVVRSIVTLSYTWVGPLSRCHRTIGALIRGPSTLANRLEGRVGRLWESRSSSPERNLPASARGGRSSCATNVYPASFVYGADCDAAALTRRYDVPYPKDRSWSAMGKSEEEWDVVYDYLAGNSRRFRARGVLASGQPPIVSRVSMVSDTADQPVVG